MRRVSLSWLLPALLVAFALIAAGCGGDDGGRRRRHKPRPRVERDIGEGKQGGAITFLAAADVDYLDPGQTYYTFGYMVQYAVNRPLYSFEPDDAENPVPDLAEGEPEISEDNKTITVTLKKGVKFSPPVNREVTSEDVKYGIERAFTTNVPSGYATSYFAEIEGAPEAPVKIGKLKPFSGLDASDPQKLVIKLTKPVAPRVAAALVMPITVPVPKEYASRSSTRRTRRRTTSTSPSPARTWSRTTPRARSPGVTRARRSRSSATRTGTRPRTTGRRSWTRSPSRRATTT